MPGAIGENAEWARIGVVMSEFGDDIQAHATVSGDRRIQCGIKARNQRFEVRPFAAGAQAYARTIARGRDLSHIGVDTEIDPHTIKSGLYSFNDAALPRPRHSVQDDDVARIGAVAMFHGADPFLMYSGSGALIPELFDWTDGRIAATGYDRGEIDMLVRNGRPIETEF